MSGAQSNMALLLNQPTWYLARLRPRHTDRRLYAAVETKTSSLPSSSLPPPPPPPPGFGFLSRRLMYGTIIRITPLRLSSLSEEASGIFCGVGRVLVPFCEIRDYKIRYTLRCVLFDRSPCKRAIWVGAAA